MERPLLLPLLCIIAGSCLAVSGFFPSPHYYVPLFILGGAALLLRSRLPFLLVLSLLFILWGDLSLKPFLQPRFSPNHVAGKVSDELQIVEGVIDSRPERTPDGCRIYIQAEKLWSRSGYSPVEGRIILYVGEGRVPYVSGDRIRFRSRLQPPRNYGLPGEYDYMRHLAFRAVFVTTNVRTVDDVLLMRQGVAFPLRRYVDKVAGVAGKAIDAAVPADEAAVLRALLLGDQGGIPRQVNDAYARSGVNHILSISGFHVGIISLVICQLLIRLASRSTFLLLHFNLRRVALLFTLPVMIFYMFLAGAAPATVRSVVMLAAFILALALERETDPLDSLLLAAVAIVALNPPALFDISFQLSFAALWGLIVLTPLLMAPFGWDSRPLLKKLLLFAMASVAATFATMLPVAFHFHRISFTGILANFLIVPLMGYGAVILGFAALPFVWVAPIIAGWLFNAAAMLVWLSNPIVAWFARFPVVTSIQPGKTVLLLFFLFALSISFVRKGWRRTLASGFTGGACVAVLALSPFGDRDSLVVSVLSVGQGESILVKLPGGKTMLVDGGGHPFSSPGRSNRDVGERLLAPALWSLGVQRIDYLVLSHPHPDHLQGFAYVAENFAIGEFWEGEGETGSPEHRRLMAALMKRKVPVRLLCAESGPVPVAGGLVEPLWPTEGSSRGTPGDDMNDTSLVFRLLVGRFSMLFTGDIGFPTEAALLSHPERLRAAVLKVPHHGSRFSTSDPFLSAVSPDAAVISAGYRNVFRLPARETVKQLQERGIRTLRTDVDGTITIACDGNGANCTVSGFKGQFH